MLLDFFLLTWLIEAGASMLRVATTPETAEEAKSAAERSVANIFRRGKRVVEDVI